MNRIYNFKWLLLLLIISGSVAYSTTRKPQLPPEPPSWQIITSDYYDGISIDGPFDIELIPSTSQNRAEIFANTEDFKQFNTDVTNNTLNISLNTLYASRQPVPVPPRWLMRIYANNLILLCLFDSANLTARSLNSSNLLIVAADDSQLYIRGMIGGLQLSIPYGNPFVDVAWVNSRDLMIEADGGSISLAGDTQFMDARLSGDAHLNVKSLRINKIWIQTTDDALAELVARHTLRAFADGNSNVLYYTAPTYLTDVTQISGNVLQMGYW
ncbi:MAG: DUF2807 domain-containing protein [Gammaproteobacteria bacterium]